MVELPDMPEDVKKYIVGMQQEQVQFLQKIGRYSHLKEKVKWRFHQALVFQLITIIATFGFFRMALIFYLLQFSGMVVIMGTAGIFSAFAFLSSLFIANKLWEKM